MLSRVAESVYWMGRYLERAEDTARVVNTTTYLILDTPRVVPANWAALVQVLGAWSTFPHGEPSERRVMDYLIQDPDHPSSIQSCVRQARENARTVRELLPTEVWEEINELHHRVGDGAAGAIARRRRLDFLRAVIQSCQQITGVIEGTLSRGAPYQFVALGRHLERADMTTRILDMRIAAQTAEEIEPLDAWDDAGWMNTLRSLSGYTMYRQYCTPRISRPAVVEFLILDEHFPRSVRYCLLRMAVALRSLPRAAAAREGLRGLEQTVCGVAPGELEPEALHAYIDELQLGLARLHGILTESYFPEPVG